MGVEQASSARRRLVHPTSDQLGQGKENARTFLRDNPDLANEIEKKILEKLGIGPQVDTPRRAPFTADAPGIDPDGIDF